MRRVLANLLDDRLLHLLLSCSHICLVSWLKNEELNSLPLDAEGPDPNREDIVVDEVDGI
jgi:hypothetical protein